MKEIVLTLAAAALICFTGDMLLPEGNLKRTARSIIALTVIEAVLYPLAIGIAQLGNLPELLAQPSTAATPAPAYSEQDYTSLAQDAVLAALKFYSEKTAHDLGTEITDCRIDIDKAGHLTVAVAARFTPAQALLWRGQLVRESGIPAARVLINGEAAAQALSQGGG